MEHLARRRFAAGKVDLVQLSQDARPLSFAEPIRVYMAAARSPPQSDPANRKFLRPRATARKARSAALLSISSMPSSV